MQTASRPPLRRLAALDHMIRSGKYPNASTAARQLEVHQVACRDIDGDARMQAFRSQTRAERRSLVQHP